MVKKNYLATTLFSSCYRYARRDSLCDTTSTESSCQQHSYSSLSLSSVEIENFYRSFISSCLISFIHILFKVIVYIYLYNTIEFKSTFSVITLIKLHLSSCHIFGSLLMAQGLWERLSLNIFNYIYFISHALKLCFNVTFSSIHVVHYIVCLTWCFCRSTFVSNRVLIC